MNDSQIKNGDCKHTDSKVYNSRPRAINGVKVVYRSRECLSCCHRWATYELSRKQISDFVNATLDETKIAVSALLDQRKHLKAKITDWYGHE